MILKPPKGLSGQIVRMVDKRTSKQLIYCELAKRKRNRCKPKKRFKYSIRTTRKSLGTDSKAKETLVSDWVGWRTKVWSVWAVWRSQDNACKTYEKLFKRIRSEIWISMAIFLCTVSDRPWYSIAGLKFPMGTHKKRTSLSKPCMP